MTNTKHLSKVDRAGARRIVKAWEMDQNAQPGRRVGYQCPSRDPLDHARFFREVWLIASERERRRMNRLAVEYVGELNDALDALDEALEVIDP